MTDRDQTNVALTTYRPSRAEIDALIQRASNHRFGKRFLVDGALDAVAATFSVHAFVVDAAREAVTASAKSALPKPELVAASAPTT